MSEIVIQNNDYVESKFSGPEDKVDDTTTVVPAAFATNYKVHR